MATCLEIESKLQAYIDDELGPPERIVCDEHLAQCSRCREALRWRKRLSARLFEAFSDRRLKRDLSQAVLDHLPEMMNSAEDMESVNWRAKHPLGPWRLVPRFAPVAAAVVLILMAFIIQKQWPSAEERLPKIGVVLQTDGHADVIPLQTERRSPVEISQIIRPDRYFETGETGRLMLGLVGPSYVKMNSGTRLCVVTERRLRLEKGEIWLDVGQDGRLFNVETPDGKVTVFGTAFGVRVAHNRTTVTVDEGNVQVENKRGDFQPLVSGQQVEMAREEAPSKPVSVDTSEGWAWSKSIEPNARAEEFFATRVAPAPLPAAASAREELFYVAYLADNIDYGMIRIVWDPSKLPQEPCGYDLFAYSFDAGEMTSLFKRRIDAAVFDLDKSGVIQVECPPGALRSVRVLNILLAPVCEGEQPEGLFKEVLVKPRL